MNVIYHVVVVVNVNVWILVLVMQLIGTKIVIVFDVLLELVNPHLHLILLEFNTLIALVEEHVIVMEAVLVNVDSNHEVKKHVNVKFVKEFHQDVLDMVLVNVMELVLVSLDGRVFQESQLVVVKLNVQITAVDMDDVIVESVLVMQDSKVPLIALVLMAVLIVTVKLNFVVVMENVLVKVDTMVLTAKTGLIAVLSKIVLLVWEHLIVVGVGMPKFVKTLFSQSIVLMMMSC